MKPESKIDYGQHQTGKMEHYIRKFDNIPYKLHQGFYSRELALERAKSLKRDHLRPLLVENVKGYAPFTIWVRLSI